MFSKIAVGVDGNDERLSVAILSQRFGRLRVVDQLRVEGSPEQVREAVAKFMDKHRAREARVTVCLPRRTLLVRFLDLPADAEAHLAKVVGFQIDTLHPFKEGEVCWDGVVVSRDREKKQIKVLVVLIEKSRLDDFRQELLALGLRPTSMTLTAACLAPFLKPVSGQDALVIFGQPQSAELLGFHRGELCATRDVAADSRQEAPAFFQWELHAIRADLPAADPAAVPTFKCGDVPESLATELADVSALPKPNLSWLLPSHLGQEGTWPALGAAYLGLKQKSVAAPNLLPADQRWQPTRTVPWFLLGLGSLAVLLAIAAGVHSWVESALYTRGLNRQIERWQMRAEDVQSKVADVEELQAKAGVLEGVRNQIWKKLLVMEQLTRILPDGTWLQQVEMDQDSVSITGLSDHAADLVKPLEDSSYFSQVEFTSPISRGADNKETFQLHMRLGKAGRP